MQYEIEQINIKSLIPSEYNPRVMSETDMLKLSKNMEKFGLVDPIIINLKNNHIIGGHQRYNILLQKNENKKLNLIRLGDIGWVFEDTLLTIENTDHEKALNLSLNSLDGEFDPDGLGAILTELQTKNYDLELTGFEDYEILDYTLDYELTSLTPPPETNDDTTGNNDVELPKDDYYLNIKFSSQEQKQKFINFIERLKHENPEQSITQNLFMYIHEKYQKPNEKKITPYTLLFENKYDYQKFKKLYKNIGHDYYQDALLNFLKKQS